MSYEEMSDFEINSAVHNLDKGLGFSLKFFGCDRIEWSKEGEQPILTEKVEYSKSGLSDYCNNPSDAWQIIYDNHISIINDYGWGACHRRSGVESSMHVNPLRAAMIVFLMMQEKAQ